jgi:uncharacterized protein
MNSTLTPGRFEERTRPDAPEQRTVDVDVEALQVRGQTVTGYAAVYNHESEDLGGFRERIAPGAFAGVLDSADVRCLLNHDPNIVLGRVKSGTLRLSDDERGLRFECDLPESRSDLKEAVSRGDIDGASFRFLVGEEEWDGELRTVKSVKQLDDVTIATYPAYPSTSVELRARSDHKETSPSPSRPGLVIRDRLRVEDRTQRSDQSADVERRVVEAMQATRKGEARSLSVTGALPIEPAELSAYLFEKLRPGSVALQSGIIVIPTDKREITWPKLSGDVNPAWVASGEAIPEGDPTLVSLKANPRKLAHLVAVENEVIDDSEPSVVDVLNNHLGTMLGLKLDLAVFEGSGENNQPKGMLKVAGIQHAKKPTGYDPFIEAVGKLAAANAPGPYVAVGPPSVFTALALLKNKNEDQLSAPKEMPKVLTTTQVAKTFVYAPSQVVLVRRQDAEIELDRSRLFNEDESEIRGKLRADVLLPNPEAIVLLDE